MHMSTLMSEKDGLPRDGEDATRRYLVVSSDSHAGPSLEHSLRPYCPKEYLREFDEFVAEVRSGSMTNDGQNEKLSHVDQLMNAALRSKQRTGTTAAAMDTTKSCLGHDDPQARLRDMDADGIAAEVIFAGGQNEEIMPFVAFGADAGPAGVDPELRIVGEQIWNDWLKDFVSVAPERLLGVAQIPIWDVGAAVRAVEWAQDAGLAAINFPAPRSDLVPYNDPIYEPFWSACEALEMPLVTHTGGGESPLGMHGPGGRQIYSYERHWLTRRHLWELIFGGVFERHPDLTVVFTEQMVAWVPETLRDLDNVQLGLTASRGMYEDPLPRLPSEYWASNCFNAGSFLARHEADLREKVGLRNLLWGSDYPHQEGTWPYTRLAMRKTFAGLPENDVRMILGENALRAYHLDPTVLRPIADRIGPSPEELAIPLDPSEIPEHRGQAFRDFENF
jgi:predicted TIM-barrel fold metal-dependent hydrolase